jgi:GT2 family glycosyltransferase
LPELNVIIVSWNSKELLKGCLDSLKSSADDELCDVIVVDNGSADGSAELVKDSFKWVKLIETGDNLGFAKANNLALKESESKYNLLLNSDTIVNKKAIKTMIDAMNENPDVWILTCMHKDGNKKDVNPSGKFPTLKSEFMTLTGIFKWRTIKALKSYLNPNVKSQDYKLPDSESKSILIEYVNWVNGACMMLRKEAGLLDERFFFYGEDVDLCLTASNKGGKIGMMQEVSIIHYGGGSSEQNYLNLLQRYMISQVQLFD